MPIERMSGESEALVIPAFEEDLDNIQKLDDEPNDVGGLTSAQLKEEFDRAGNAIKDYLNDTLLPAISETVAEREIWMEKETHIDEAEAGRVSAEEARVEAENLRAGAETDRETAETARDTAEGARATAEGNRATAEEGRAAAETARAAEEGKRATAETARASAETARATAESGRVTAEGDRVTAEEARVLAEQQRADETAGIVAQATTQAQAAAGSAGAAAGSATAAAGSAETAEGHAQDAGESAGAAANSATQAAGSAGAAAGSATQAAGSATAAADSAGESQESALDSEAWAVGQRGGVDVPGTDETYQNNAKYYAQQAAEIVGGDFATRTEAQGYASAAKSEAIAAAEEDAAAKADAAESAAKAASIPLADKGAASGVATLDASGKLTAAQKPAYTAAEVGALATQAGAAGQFLGFTAPNVVGAVDAPASGGKRVARLTVGTSTSGWTADDCDYLCDGTDDQEEINAAIQALPDTGGEVVILDGTYNITAEISVNKDYVMLSGNGKSTVLKRMWDSSSAAGIVYIQSSNCTIQNLTFNGNKNTYTSSTNCGIRCKSGADYTTISGNICALNYVGISIGFSYHTTITGNICKTGYIGIKLSQLYYSIVAGNLFIENSNYAIQSGNIAWDTIIGNSFYNNYKYGLSIGGATHITITGNSVTGSEIGIKISFTNKATVAGNTICENDIGIQVESKSSSINSEITIVGNTIIRGDGLPTDYSSNQYTIFLKDAYNSYNLIADNNIMGKNYVCEGGESNTFVNNKYE